MLKSARTAKGISFVLAGMLAAAPVSAVAQQAPPPQQNAPAQQGAPSQAAPAADFSDEKLESYAEAVVGIQEVNQKWQTEMNAAQSQEEADKIREQSFTEMEKVVQDKGLTVQEYNDITVAAQSNPDLNQEILAMINEEAGR
ncbi:DUF4168 domain-containing protein [Tepidicaulis sp. LMO-SS28]|uniref:DUF4168 domain-containing protein n=1 Tax=Tepidicaulis sp. LMO-SS28 TaxID=3447455 RepID=UPI003EDEADF0